MTEIRFDRLLKLADFLDTLPRERFDFNVIRLTSDCGTVGCALGWTPEVFPGLVRLGRRNFSVPICGDTAACWIEAFCEKLFGIGERDAQLLFIPVTYGCPPWLEKPLYYNAAPCEVAASIRAYCVWKQRQLGLLSEEPAQLDVDCELSSDDAKILVASGMESL